MGGSSRASKVKSQESRVESQESRVKSHSHSQGQIRAVVQLPAQVLDFRFLSIQVTVTVSGRPMKEKRGSRTAHLTLPATSRYFSLLFATSRYFLYLSPSPPLSTSLHLSPPSRPSLSLSRSLFNLTPSHHQLIDPIQAGQIDVMD